MTNLCAWASTRLTNVIHNSIACVDEADRFSFVAAFPFEEWEIVVEELIDHGDQVIVMTRQRGRGAGSGVAAELEQAHVVTVRGGKTVRVDSYLDRTKALEAAGLSE
jgi:ketosteroid isomerase-like protein